MSPRQNRPMSETSANLAAELASRDTVLGGGVSQSAGSINVAALMLAAGQSKRFNGIKQLAQVNGQPMLLHTLTQLTEHGDLTRELSEFNLVLGANAAHILPHVPDYVSPCIFPQWQQGMGATIAFGVQKANSESSHLLVTLADQVAITREQVTTMLHHCAANPENIIAARYKGILGAPVIFPRTYFSLLSELDADTGARKILQQYSTSVVAIDLPNAQFDIDTQLELQQWHQSMGQDQKN